MRKIPFRRTVAVAVLFSLMLWTAGCTSFQAVKDWREHPEIPIQVTTKNEAEYQLVCWKADSLGNLSGKGKVTVPYHWPEDFEGKIAADSIAAVKADREDWREHPEVVPVRMKMIDGTEYELEQWRVDSLGMVSGMGSVRPPLTWSALFTSQWKAGEFRGTFPADSISVVRANRSDLGLTLFLAIPVTILIVGAIAFGVSGGIGGVGGQFTLF